LWIFRLQQIATYKTCHGDKPKQESQLKNQSAKIECERPAAVTMMFGQVVGVCSIFKNAAIVLFAVF
jgi:hypothetical protein